MSTLRRFLSAAAVVAALSSIASNASADDKRPEQDYGRPKEPTTAGDVLAWPVRVVLFPFFLVNEFIFRRPIGWLVVETEKHGLVEAVTDFFTFGPKQNITLYPSALFDFGLLPSVGFNLAWKEFLAEPNTLRTHFGFWGPTWINAKITNEYRLSKRETLSVSASFTRRRDNPFFGVGPFSDQSNWTRFGAQSFEVAPAYSHDYWRSSNMQFTAGFRGLDFFHGTCCGDDSLDYALGANRFPPEQRPQSYGQDYYGGFQRAKVALDTREARPAPGSGFRVEAHEETMFDISKQPRGLDRNSWVKWGGSIGGAIDVTGHQRVLALSVHTEFADAIRGNVPFTDQVTLGGDDLMPGYIRNRMIDRSAAVAHVQYTWPVWVYLDGIIGASMGNVWGEHLENFKVQDSRLAAALGVRSNGNRDSGFELLVGAGTDPLSQGFAPSSFRFLLGSHHGL